MADVEEFRCFIGNLSWSTTDESLKDAFGKFGNLTEAKVVLDKFSGRSRGFGFVTFDEKKAMEDAVEEMNGLDLDGRNITVDKAQPQGPGRDRIGDRDFDRECGSRHDRGRDYGGGRALLGGGGGDCFKCGKPGHFARECPSGDSERGDIYMVAEMTSMVVVVAVVVMDLIVVVIDTQAAAEMVAAMWVTVTAVTDLVPTDGLDFEKYVPSRHGSLSTTIRHMTWS